jgi:N-formylglutamate amidohydrolase
MNASILAELTPPYTLLKPAEQLAPVVFCSPHSGRIYPRALLEASRLDPHTLRKSEDCYDDQLFQPVVALGAPLIAARFPRAYLDVNREPYELDPELFQGRLPAFANTQSARVIGGLGTIARMSPTPRRSIASGCRWAWLSSESKGCTGRSMARWPACSSRRASASARQS